MILIIIMLCYWYW